MPSHYPLSPMRTPLSACCARRDGPFLDPTNTMPLARSLCRYDPQFISGMAESLAVAVEKSRLKKVNRWVSVEHSRG